MPERQFNVHRRLRAGLLAAALAATAAAHAESAADRFAGVEVEARQVRDNVYMLTGAGGNIGVSVGADGTLIIDDQFAPLADRITAALAGIDGDAPKLVLNTHFHGDHTGSNPIFGEVATIVAHDNVRARLALQQDFPARGLPVLTYAEAVTVHFNGDTLEVIHLPAGHTDGDSVVWFRGANVLHTGDLLFKDRFPFIDQSSGGSVPGVIVNLTRLVEMLPEDVAIIPGHGPLAGRADLEATLGMIRATRAEVLEALGRGRSVDEIVADGLDPQWASWGSGFINEERWIRTLAASGP
ncbi:MAG: MBL fold metallo-hydrolase [Gammaproteobacteria bacterium]|nr:MBL fold metallo-hydrolase [Gammaproteobacteria bacterium]